MTERPFVDYYEVLQISQSADSETLERVYRLLAKRYHPDNQTTGDSSRFSEVHEAYEVLNDPKRRAAYDVKYDDNRSVQWKIFDQNSAADGRESDRRLFHGILSLLYVARRRDPLHGGLGAVSLEKLLGVPRQHLEFPLWYLRQRGWLETLDSGQLAITVSGIDKMADRELELPADRLLAASSLVESREREAAGSGDEAGAQRKLETGDGAPGEAPPGPAAPGEPTPASAAGAPQRGAAPSAGDFPSEESGGDGPTPASASGPDSAEAELLSARERARSVAQRLRGQP